MTSRLKRKLNDLGVDPASAKANESFCLVRRGYRIYRQSSSSHGASVDRHTATSSGEVEGYGGVCSTMEAGCAYDSAQTVNGAADTACASCRSETRKVAGGCMVLSRAGSRQAISTLLVQRRVRSCLYLLFAYLHSDCIHPIALTNRTTQDGHLPHSCRRDRSERSRKPHVRKTSWTKRILRSCKRAGSLSTSTRKWTLAGPRRSYGDVLALGTNQSKSACLTSPQLFYYLDCSGKHLIDHVPCVPIMYLQLGHRRTRSVPSTSTQRLSRRAHPQEDGLAHRAGHWSAPHTFAASGTRRGIHGLNKGEHGRGGGRGGEEAYVPPT